MKQQTFLMVLVVLVLAACGGAPQTPAGSSASTTAPAETTAANNAVETSVAATEAPATTAADAATAAATEAPATSSGRATSVPAAATEAPATGGRATIVPAGAATAETGGTQPLQEITMAMAYIPTVQFAHFYVADKKGYYVEEGINVTFDYNFETDVVQRVAQGTGQFGLASGDSVLLARAQGLPIVTIATNSQTFPVVFFSKAEQNITTPEDLKGKTVGIPGRFGASYIGLLALLYANNIQENELNIQEIGFTQAAAVSEDKVQVAAGYGNNEPIQLDQQGIKHNTIRVADSFPLASDGIVTNESIIQSNPELARGFVRATLRGMQDVIANPDEGFTISLEYVTELAAADPATQDLQRKVLTETMTYWQSDLTEQAGLGAIDQASWEATATFLRDSKLLRNEVDLSTAFTTEFLP
jgi:NitT/TauT family transport system substrate-binding protein